MVDGGGGYISLLSGGGGGGGYEIRDIVSEYASDVDRTSCVRTFTWWRLRGQVDQQSMGCRGKQEDVTWHGMARRGVAWHGMAPVV